MTPAQTIQIRLSECRQRLNELLGVETRSDEQTTEMESLTNEVSTKEPALRAALAAEPDPQTTTIVDTSDPEQREVAELRSRSSVTSYVQAALEMRSVDGAEREFNAALSMGADQFPLALLVPEERQTTAVDVSTNQQTCWIACSIRRPPSALGCLSEASVRVSLPSPRRPQERPQSSWTSREPRPLRPGPSALRK